jgi:hypothetical protein
MREKVLPNQKKMTMNPNRREHLYTRSTLSRSAQAIVNTVIHQQQGVPVCLSACFTNVTIEPAGLMFDVQKKKLQGT